MLTAGVVGLFVIKTAMGDVSTVELQAAEENVTSVPGANTPWYAVGAMPLFLVSGVVLALSIVVSYLLSFPKMGDEQS